MNYKTTIEVGKCREKKSTTKIIFNNKSLCEGKRNFNKRKNDKYISKGKSM